MPFLSVVTRTCRRPVLLQRNKASLLAQTDQDYEHIIIVDEKGKGLYEANKSLYENRNRVNGEFVLIVDDDDYVSDKELVQRLKEVARQKKIDVILFKMNRKPFKKILPSKRVWGRRPILGDIGAPCFAVKSDVWKRHIRDFGKPKHGDFHFIKTLFGKGYSRYWLDRVMVTVDRISGGKLKPVIPQIDKIEDQVTVIIVNYCTKALTNEARRTMMQYYPKVPIILIDNGSNDESTRYVELVEGMHPNITAILNKKNIGHGPAMHQGIKMAKTPYVFLYDSDASLKRYGVLDVMLTKFSKDAKLYAIGWMRQVDKFTGVSTNKRGKGIISYIHPHAAMLDRAKYLELKPMINSGAPCISNMRDALERGYHLKGFATRPFVKHLVAGTRRMFGGHWKPGATVKPTSWRTNAKYPI